jgi:hypothetical protein
MTTIYDLHRKAFNQVSAFVILDESGERVATIAFKFPKDGAGRLWCYFHLIGLEMSRGYAGGYGYDKKSASVCNAIENIKPFDFSIYSNTNREELQLHADELNEKAYSLKNAFDYIGGKDWIDVLRDKGYKVLQAV